MKNHTRKTSLSWKSTFLDQRQFRTLFIAITLCLCSSFTFLNAQVSGVLTDDTGEPLIGVSVLKKGTTSGTISDIDGSYSINATNGDVLVYSYIGYVDQEIVVGDGVNYTFTMATDSETLDEVVVVGYGSRKKSDITGAVASVTEDELTAFPVLDAAQALQGRAAGVDVQSNNGGEPGAPINIRIRGNTSINASSAPLIVVDGFVGASFPQANDIASIEVLKDASATAIYGSRGSNGVVIVTTKKGKSGQLSVELNTSFATQSTANELDLLNADQFADYQNQIRANQGNAVPYPQGDADTDWQDEIYEDGHTQQHQLSVAGGSEKVNYYVSGNYFNQEGVVVNSGFERTTFLTNLDIQATKKLKLGANLFGSRGIKDGVTTQSDGSVTVGGDDVISLAARFAPDKPIIENGQFTTNDAIGDEVDNPYAVATQRVDETTSNDFRANVYLDYEILSGLSFKTTFGLSSENERRGIYQPSSLIITASAVDGRASITDANRRNIISENYLTYNRDFGQSGLTLLAGYSYQQSNTQAFSAAGTGFLSDNFSFHALGTATGLLQPNSFLSDVEIESQFGRVNYDFDDKLLLTATIRRDGASNFAANNKHAIFPSAAIAYKLDREAFLADSKVVSGLKLRGSWGRTGNPSISPFQSLARFASLYASSNGETVFAITPDQPANPDLRWETSSQINLGVDLGLINNRINVSFDFYDIDTEDLILGNNGIPEYFGFASDEILTNLGEINNRGIELSLNTKNIVKGDFKWNTDFNISRNSSEVVALINDADFFGDATPSYFSHDRSFILREGEEVGLFWGFDYAGVYQGGDFPEGTATLEGGVAGDPLFFDIADEDGVQDGEITEADRTIIGNPNPDFTFGFNNTFSYQGFDLNIFFQGSQGGEIFNLTDVQLNNGDANTTVDYFNDAWTPSNTNTDQPRVGNNSNREISSRFVEDGSYIRLKNIALGYNLPSSVVENLGIGNVRFAISAQNLLTFTSYTGLDPEANFFGSSGPGNTSSNVVRGFDFGNYPTIRSVLLSLNVKF